MSAGGFVAAVMVTVVAAGIIGVGRAVWARWDRQAQLAARTTELQVRQAELALRQAERTERLAAVNQATSRVLRTTRNQILVHARLGDQVLERAERLDIALPTAIERHRHYVTATYSGDEVRHFVPDSDQHQRLIRRGVLPAARTVVGQGPDRTTSDWTPAERRAWLAAHSAPPETDT